MFPCRAAYLSVHFVSWIAVLGSLPLLLSQINVLPFLPPDSTWLLPGAALLLCGAGGLAWSGGRLRTHTACALPAASNAVPRAPTAPR